MKMGEKEVMLGVPEGDQDVVELTQRHAMIDLPEDAVEVELNVTIYHNGALEKVSRVMSMVEVQKAFAKGDDYIDDDDVFVLTEKGRAYIETLDGEDTRPF